MVRHLTLSNVSSFVSGFVDSRSERATVETSVVAFLDILGFKAFTRENISNADRIDKLDYLLHIAEKMLSGRVGVAQHTSIRMFSDCISVSCPLSTPNLIRLICALEALQFYLINSGLIIRGGMSIGRQCSTSRLLVSEALVLAYELESTKAIFARIVLDRTITEAVRAIPSEEWFDPWGSCRRDIHSPELHIQHDPCDSVPFLHYFAYMHSIDSAPLERELLFAHRHAIQRLVDQTASEPEQIKRKYRWLASYFNRSEAEYHDRFLTSERYQIDQRKA